MEYKMIKRGVRDLRMEKHMESKGFFRNATGPSKVGELKIYNSTEDGWLENFLTEEDEVYYMILGCPDDFGLISQEGVPLISIGDKEHNIPVEDRIGFLYETLSANTKYEGLEIIYKDSNIFGCEKTFFTVDFIGNNDGIIEFNISD